MFIKLQTIGMYGGTIAINSEAIDKVQKHDKGTIITLRCGDKESVTMSFEELLSELEKLSEQ